MGGAISSQRLAEEQYKPLDASDIETLEGGKAEISRLRELLSKQTNFVSVRDEQAKGACITLKRILELRATFVNMEVQLVEPYVGPVLENVMSAMEDIVAAMENPAVSYLAHQALHRNDLAFKDYKLTNDLVENVAAKEESADSDIYTIPKVDTHLHLSGAMTSPQLLSFLREIYTRDGDRMVPGTDETLGAILEKTGLTTATVEQMDTQATAAMFHNFGEFNAAFIPFKSKRLRDLVFKPDDTMFNGEYLAEYIGRLAQVNAPHNIILEPRISIYGKAPGEWSTLARWFAMHKPVHQNVLWTVQLPRVFPVWAKMGSVQSFGEYLSNFFGPMFAASLRPEEHPQLAELLCHVGAIDTVDDESKADAYSLRGLPSAAEYTNTEGNAPYAYYHFYVWYNIRALNYIRAAAGLNTFQLRPHAGEAGPVHHLATTFLLCDGISHGINLEKNQVIQYLYYLAQVPISVSPISNSALFLKYMDNPFPKFHHRGLCVALTTDDPLQFHMTPMPLLEEYATARHTWGMSMPDLCECARNSVLLSSMSPTRKKELVGEDDCDGSIMNVPNRRLQFRKEILRTNLENLEVV